MRYKITITDRLGSKHVRLFDFDDEESAMDQVSEIRRMAESGATQIGDEAEALVVFDAVAISVEEID